MACFPTSYLYLRELKLYRKKNAIQAKARCRCFSFLLFKQPGLQPNSHRSFLQLQKIILALILLDLDHRSGQLKKLQAEKRSTYMLLPKTIFIWI
jgi:hypothetical protein